MTLIRVVRRQRVKLAVFLGWVFNRNIYTATVRTPTCLVSKVHHCTGTEAIRSIGGIRGITLLFLDHGTRRG